MSEHAIDLSTAVFFVVVWEHFLWPNLKQFYREIRGCKCDEDVTKDGDCVG